jgi:hypothetical protein
MTVVVIIHKDKKEKEMSKKRTPMAQVVEKKDSFEILRINYISEPSIIKPNKKYIQLTESVAEEAIKQLKNNKVVDIPKGLKKITKSNIVISEPNSLDRKKNIARSKIMQKINELFININFLDLYDFMMINNKFSSAGIFIHEGNREEQYLKIINTGNEDMIDNLEKYLERMDELNNINSRHKKLMNIFKQINLAEDEETIDKLINRE